MSTKNVGYCKHCGEKFESWFDEAAPHHLIEKYPHPRRKGQPAKINVVCPGSYQNMTFVVRVPLIKVT